jgi:predicted RNA binding protein YcfA (HicA-like mRNA interferase family)
VRLPRDLSGDTLAQALTRLGYTVTRQTGSHLRLTTQRHGEHHLTIPRHHALRLGTLNEILKDAAAHEGITRDEVVKLLFE